MKSVQVLGVRIDDVSLYGAVDIVKGWLDSDKKGAGRYIVTPNPEFLMLARRDREFKELLNESDLSIPDGSGLLLSGRVKNTTTGVDLMEELCRLSGDCGFTVGLLGGKDGVAEKTKQCLLKKYPKLKIVFAESGPIISETGEVLSSKYYGKEKIQDPLIQNTYPFPQVDILFIALGQGKQERWISQNLSKSEARVMMGVGGAFDYLSGEVKRAPLLIRKIRFEWLFRLITQPWRIKRQLALFQFIFLVIKERLFGSVKI